MSKNTDNDLKTIIEQYSTESNTNDIKSVDKKCAPGIKFGQYSCISLDVLVKLATNYNKHNPNNMIELNRNYEILYPKKYKKYLVDELTEKFKNTCSNQHCWLTTKYAEKIIDKYNKKLTEIFFRPIGPQGKFTWLNTININQVMDQFHHLYDDFIFLGAVPMDFMQVASYKYIQNLQVKELLEHKKTRIGIIYNLDNHNQPGSHWVAGYIDINKPVIYYYDSYATRPGKRVREFYDKLQKDIKATTQKEPIIDYNKTRNQYGDSECGMFSLYFIISLLKGIDFEKACKEMPDDKTINEKRKELFILPEELKK
ncbi:Ulp1 protease [Hokovirus HKV1]|uniref:Ulp1 protease n=1 Tax=Hokovirus HKV1 TaxID=1977638 RepID=A0A1V0SGH4_9VIRU|nr:Ulp1 protease [Hokovirus HKV1]